MSLSCRFCNFTTINEAVLEDHTITKHTILTVTERHEEGGRAHGSNDLSTTKQADEQHDPPSQIRNVFSSGDEMPTNQNSKLKDEQVENNHILGDIKPEVENFSSQNDADRDALIPIKSEPVDFEQDDYFLMNSNHHGVNKEASLFHSAFTGDMKEGRMYCRSCSFCNDDTTRLKLHLFENHPRDAFFVATKSAGIHTFKWFCVKEDCAFTTNLCSSYQDHLVSCCPLRQNLSEEETQRRIATCCFIVTFLEELGSDPVPGFQDYVSVLNSNKAPISSTVSARKSLSKISRSKSKRKRGKVERFLENVQSSSPTSFSLFNSDSAILTENCSHLDGSQKNNDNKTEMGADCTSRSSLFDRDGLGYGENSLDGGMLLTPEVQGMIMVKDKIKVDHDDMTFIKELDESSQDVAAVALDFEEKITSTSHFLHQIPLSYDSDDLPCDYKIDCNKNSFGDNENVAGYSQDRELIDQLMLPLSSHQKSSNLTLNGVTDCVEDDANGLPSMSEQKFECNVCGKNFSKRGYMMKHMKIHNRDKSYICNECGKSFGEKGNLIRHLRTHTGEKPFKCNECGKTFFQNYSLVKHMKAHARKKERKKNDCFNDIYYENMSKTLLLNIRIRGEERPFKCDHCGQGFSQKNNLINHIRVHTGEKPFKCNACGKSFSEKSNLLRHIRTHTGEKPFKCDECGKSFGQSSNLHKHIRTHTGEKPFICNACGKCFGRNTNLLKHIRTHTGEKPFKCDECGKSYAQNSNLIKHIRTHTGEKPFKCNECGKSFSQNTYLINHMRTHTGDKPFQCTVCNKNFSQNGNLIQHMKTHTGERPFQCNECHSSFCFKINLVKHMRRHTGEKPYRCNECGRSFSRGTSYLEHKKRMHSDEKPFKCDVCCKNFAQKSDLSHHMRCHTYDKPYACEECNQSFRYKSKLLRHMSVHSRKKSFKCEECDKTFQHLGSLQTHMKTHAD